MRVRLMIICGWLLPALATAADLPVAPVRPVTADYFGTQVVIEVGSGKLLGAARDALYVFGFREGLGVVTRIPYGGARKPDELARPLTGSIGGFTTEHRRDGFTLTMQGWTSPKLIYEFAPHGRSFGDTGLQQRSPVDMAQIAADEVLVPLADGTTVPLSILHRRDLPLDGTHPTLLTAYGAYGISLAATFDVGMLPWLNRGGILAIAHVRAAASAARPGTRAAPRPPSSTRSTISSAARGI